MQLFTIAGNRAFLSNLFVLLRVGLACTSTCQSFQTILHCSHFVEPFSRPPPSRPSDAFLHCPMCPICVRRSSAVNKTGQLAVTLE